MSEAYQRSCVSVRNPDASGNLTLDIYMMANTPAEKIAENIKANAARDLPWLQVKPAHEGQVVIVGGGPSAADHVADIKALKDDGAFVIALNGASKWLRSHGIVPDVQFVIDAKPETASLVDSEAHAHLFASRCDPETFAKVQAPTVCHVQEPGVEDSFPPEKRQRGGYALIGGGVCSGNAAVCAAYVMGYRKAHLFGYDCSNRDDKTHAYAQPMNEGIPSCIVPHNGQEYVCAMTMKLAAESFMQLAWEFKALGFEMEIYGSGLLPAVYRDWLAARESASLDVSEVEKYQRMWTVPAYRSHSPGESQRNAILAVMNMPIGATVLDFGCGSGRLTRYLIELGYKAEGIDFAANCLDPGLKDVVPFTVANLWQLPSNLKASFGICCDVMEHIPPEKVEAVLANIKMAAPTVFFNIATRPDVFGSTIGETLHLTVRTPEWWLDKLARYWTDITVLSTTDGEASFLCITEKEQF